MTLYTSLLKPVLFRMDPETVHNRVIRLGSFLGKSSLTQRMIRTFFCYTDKALETDVAGIHFDNPIGLAAGFDKNAQLYNILPDIGFGFAELGSITGEPCQGNAKPRLFRVPNERSIIVNYGLCNLGCAALSQHLKHTPFRIPIGFSIARTNRLFPSIHKSIQDYRIAYLHMHPLGAYTTINISCPNNVDGQLFSEPANLAQLLKTIHREKHLKPVFLKIKPDYTPTQLREIVALAEHYDWITGFVLTNLTRNRDGLHTTRRELDVLSLTGGLSGLPVQHKSTETIKIVRTLTDKILIGCGGVFTGKDAYEKLKSGASLIQLVTALIYEGPGVISRINKELAAILHHKGFASVRELTSP